MEIMYGCMSTLLHLKGSALQKHFCFAFDKIILKFKMMPFTKEIFIGTLNPSFWNIFSTTFSQKLAAWLDLVWGICGFKVENFN